jgi:hypothetical protein
MLRILLAVLSLVIFCLLAQKNSQQELFEKVFGEKVLFDQAIVSQLKNNPQERVKLDTDRDGKIDVIYFIDHDPKHLQEFRPILVKAIDSDGDMDREGEADLIRQRSVRCRLACRWNGRCCCGVPGRGP